MPTIEIPVERARIVVRLAASAAPQDREQHVDAWLDTATTQSFLSSHLIEQLGAETAGSVAVTTMGIASRRQLTYPVHVRVPAPQMTAESSLEHFQRRIVAVRSDDRFDGRHPATFCDMLIGMDLIRHWHVEISNNTCVIGW